MGQFDEYWATLKELNEELTRAPDDDRQVRTEPMSTGAPPRWSCLEEMIAEGVTLSIVAKVTKQLHFMNKDFVEMEKDILLGKCEPFKDGAIFLFDEMLSKWLELISFNEKAFAQDQANTVREFVIENLERAGFIVKQTLHPYRRTGIRTFLHVRLPK